MQPVNFIAFVNVYIHKLDNILIQSDPIKEVSMLIMNGLLTVQKKVKSMKQLPATPLSRTELQREQILLFQICADLPS
jgi:hypothetical protein